MPWEGCCACWDNDDHRNILLCDGCDLEYHYYCVQPPLPDIPSGMAAVASSLCGCDVFSCSIITRPTSVGCLQVYMARLPLPGGLPEPVHSLSSWL